MAAGLGPIEIQCDAPPYSIIQACQWVGIERPEDVRWSRMSHFLSEDNERHELFNVHAWKSFLGMSRAGRMSCTCGHALPRLEKCTFTFITGKEVSYYIGQCERCKSVFWEEI
jgi:hypothetical protein